MTTNGSLGIRHLESRDSPSPSGDALIRVRAEMGKRAGTLLDLGLWCRRGVFAVIPEVMPLASMTRVPALRRVAGIAALQAKVPSEVAVAVHRETLVYEDNTVWYLTVIVSPPVKPAPVRIIAVPGGPSVTEVFTEYAVLIRPSVFLGRSW